MSVITIPQLPTPEFFNQELNQYLERLADAIWHIQPEIWEIINAFKDALEEKDRLQRINTDLDPVEYYCSANGQPGFGTRKMPRIEVTVIPAVRAGCGIKMFKSWRHKNLTPEQNAETDMNNMIEYYRRLKISELKAECKERGIQVGGKKSELMTKLVAYSYYGMKLVIKKELDIFAALEYAPQKMYDAAIKCEAATTMRDRTLSRVNNQLYDQRYYYRTRTHTTCKGTGDGYNTGWKQVTRKYQGHMLNKIGKPLWSRMQGDHRYWVAGEKLPRDSRVGLSQQQRKERHDLIDSPDRANIIFA